MIEKIIAFIEVLVGLTFFIGLLSFIPIIGSVIGGILGKLLGLLNQIPYYSIILSLFGTVLFFDGLIKLIHH